MEKAFNSFEVFKHKKNHLKFRNGFLIYVLIFFSSKIKKINLIQIIQLSASNHQPHQFSSLVPIFLSRSYKCRKALPLWCLFSQWSFLYSRNRCFGLPDCSWRRCRWRKTWACCCSWISSEHRCLQTTSVSGTYRRKLLWLCSSLKVLLKNHFQFWKNWCCW